MISFDWAADPSEAAAVPGPRPRALDEPATREGDVRASLEDCLAAFRLGRSGTRRWVVGGGEPTATVRAVAAVATRFGDEVALVPPTSDGTLDAEAFDAALALGGRRPTVAVVGAAAQTGVLQDLEDLAHRSDLMGVDLVLDASLAVWSPGHGLVSLHHASAVLCALDRWHGARPGTWWMSSRAGCVPAAPPDLARRVLQADRVLRAAVSGHPQVRTWPGSRHSTPACGLVGFTLEGWLPTEAAAVLRESFGIAIEAGALTAVPLPGPAALPGLLRVSLGPDTGEREIALFADALHRLAGTAAAWSPPRPH